MRQKLSNIYRLGVKELWSLWRDPTMLVLILFGAVYWIMHTHELSQPMDEPEPVSA